MKQQYADFLLILGTLLILTQLATAGQGEEKTWCWTTPVKKSEQSAWNPAIGGSNWAFCASEGGGKKGVSGRVPYRVFVETSNIAGAGSTGQFYLTLFGEEGKSEEFLLTTSGC